MIKKDDTTAFQLIVSSFLNGQLASGSSCGSGSGSDISATWSMASSAIPTQLSAIRSRLYRILEKSLVSAASVSYTHLHGNCGLYAEVTMEKGTELGFNRNYGESETYYILSGEADYNDNGTVRPVRAGDVTYTPSGKGHGLTNTGDGEFVFMALIIKD